MCHIHSAHDLSLASTDGPNHTAWFCQYGGSSGLLAGQTVSPGLTCVPRQSSQERATWASPGKEAWPPVPSSSVLPPTAGTASTCALSACYPMLQGHGLWGPLCRVELLSKSSLIEKTGGELLFRTSLGEEEPRNGVASPSLDYWQRLEEGTAET